MESAFRLSYSEHEVVSKLSTLLKEPKDAYSVTLPVSRQNKGWDLLVHSAETSRAVRVQVKASRCFFEGNPDKYGFTHTLWFNNFRKKLDGSDLYALFGVYPTDNLRSQTRRSVKNQWHERTMIFHREEADQFLPPESKKFFYVAFHEDEPDAMKILDGSRREIATFDYEKLRSSSRISIVRDMLSPEPPDLTSLVRMVPPLAA